MRLQPETHSVYKDLDNLAFNLDEVTELKDLVNEAVQVSDSPAVDHPLTVFKNMKKGMKVAGQ